MMYEIRGWKYEIKEARTLLSGRAQSRPICVPKFSTALDQTNF